MVTFLKYIKSNQKGEYLFSEDPGPSIDYDLDCSYEFTAEIKKSAGNNKSGSALSAAGVLNKAEFSIIVEGENVFALSLNRTSEVEGNVPLYKLTFPRRYFEECGMSRVVMPQSDEEVDKVAFVCLLKGLLPSVIIAEAVPKENEKRSENQHEWQRWPIPPILELVFKDWRNALFNIHYVAPLRTPGKRFYVADLDVTPGMDPTGEFLPYILRDKHDSIVANCLPIELGKQIDQTLSVALGGWLEYFRTGKFDGIRQEQFEYELAGDSILLELKLKSVYGNTKHSLADSGFGYSQIVPVIVRGLLLPVDGTLVVEQPELHLHPALQVRIADFFLAMISIGKQVIIETHSEHLVNAFRVRIAEDDVNSIQNDCKIYFLEAREGKTTVHDLSVKEDGTLTDWPVCFFGEALELTGRMLRAQKRFKKI